MDTLVASLVATVTFAAMFQVPAGTTKGGDDEMALQALFQVFLFSNCLAFFASITVIIAWIFRERLHERLAMDQSPLAKLSLISLEISVMSTALAFLCATILVTIPHQLTGKKNGKHVLNEYRFIFGGEILTSALVPTMAILILGLIWAYEYYFRATTSSRQKHKAIFRQVVIYLIPPLVVILIVIIIYGLNKLNIDKEEMY
ncbi:hypothetical protein SUGI_0549550 [Cryptomeria japonica]|nr:hypothetical protein SUGI_0549550 [Cryptomeria japonica]